MDITLKEIKKIVLGVILKNTITAILYTAGLIYPFLTQAPKEVYWTYMNGAGFFVAFDSNKEIIKRAVFWGVIIWMGLWAIYYLYKIVILAWTARIAGLKGSHKRSEQIIDTIGEKIKDAKNVSILMVTGQDTLGKVDNPSAIKNAISNYSGSGKIKIMLMQPGCEEMDSRAKSAEGNPQDYKENAERSIEYIKGLKEKEFKIDYRLYPQKPIWKIIIIDDLIYLQSYPVRGHSDLSRIYRIKRKKNGLYDMYEKIFSKKWEENTQRTTTPPHIYTTSGEPEEPGEPLEPALN